MEVSEQAMAADKQVSAASRRRKRLSGWVLSQFQVTLAVCGIVVGFLVCFGLGFLSGVWFQTQEQMLPHDDAITLADNQLDRERKASGREMTFYSTLTSRDGTSEPELQPRSPATPAVSSEMASPSPSSDSQMRKSANQDATEVKGAEKTSAGHLRTAASSMSTASASQAATPTTSKSKGTASVALPNPPEALFYSVQVGSFRKVEQAYRLQDQLIKKGYQARIGLSIVEGKGAWYRVRVGRYADRGSANKTAQRLQNIENIDVLVMRVSS
ncbi:hypothetical protein C2W62_15550 [Candidatus Entotheonella serta]|nr:hypothetical protein C2W62_15550 [Candidatus Entotheonella serta]